MHLGKWAQDRVVAVGTTLGASKRRGLQHLVPGRWPPVHSLSVVNME